MKSNAIFFVIPTIYRAATILDTGIFKTLNQRGIPLVIISPFANDLKPRDAFQKPNIILENLPKPPKSFFISLVLKLRAFFLRIDNPRVREGILIEESIRVGRKTKRAFIELLIIIAVKLTNPLRGFLSLLFDRLEEKIFVLPEYSKIFETHEPAAVGLGTTGSDMHDLIFLAAARKFNVSSVIVDLPWSYFDNRLFHALRPITKIAVWTDIFKEKLINIHKMPAENITITGSARYDSYAKEERLEKRESFFKKLGADPKKSLITYATISDAWHPFQPAIIRRLLETARRGQFKKPCELLVRLGPNQERAELYYKVKKEFPELLIENSHDPDKPSYKDHLFNLLHLSDVILSVGSSLALDAAILKTPMIYLGFTGLLKPHPCDEVLKMIYQFDFLKKAIATGGVEIAWNYNELTQKINEFLENRNLKNLERENLVKEFLGELDAKAGERIANMILEVSR